MPDGPLAMQVRVSVPTLIIGLAIHETDTCFQSPWNAKSVTSPVGTIDVHHIALRQWAHCHTVQLRITNVFLVSIHECNVPIFSSTLVLVRSIPW